MAALSASAVWFFYSHGWLQWYGDAEAHLDNARRIFDSQRPGYDQLGSPWLPIPHLLLLPFVRMDSDTTADKPPSSPGQTPATSDAPAAISGK